MPKMKSNRGAAKRFRSTGTGKVRRGKANGNHMHKGKSAAQLRRIRKHSLIDSADEKRVKRLLPYGF